MRNSPHSFSAAVLTLLFVYGSSSADERPLERLLPKSTVALVKLESFERVMSQSLIKGVRQSTAFKSLWRSPDVMKLRAGMTLVEFAMGDKIENLLQGLTAQSACMAIDMESQGAVLLAHTESQEWAEEYVQKLVKLARSDAQNKKQPDPIQEAKYRGIQGYEFQKIIFGTFGSIVIVTNKHQLAQDIVDRYLDSTDDSVTGNACFQRVMNTAAGREFSKTDGGVAFAYVDLGILREAGVASDLLKGKRNDFGAEILLGGLLSTLQKTSFAMASLKLQEDKLQLDLSMPHESNWTQVNHSFFVGKEGRGYAPALANPSNILGSIGAYRNLSELWLRAGDLFDEKVNDQLAQADSTLTTLFSGKDFGTDILGAVEPQIQIVAAEQEYEAGTVPAIQLPSFGLIGTLKDPKMKKELKRTFQSFIGFLNVAGAMNGQPQLDLDSETLNETQIYTATYLKESDRSYDNGLPIQFNFSPSLAFLGDKIFVSSTSALIKALTKAETDASQVATDVQSTSSAPNTLLRVNANTLKSILQSNRQQLITQNMLEKGHSKTEAEKEVTVLMDLLGLLRSMELSLWFDEFASVKLDIDFNTN